MLTVSPLVKCATVTPAECTCGSRRMVEVGPLRLALDALLVHLGSAPVTSCPVPAPPDVEAGLVCGLCGAFAGWLA